MKDTNEDVNLDHFRSLISYSKPYNIEEREVNEFAKQIYNEKNIVIGIIGKNIPKNIDF